MPNLMDRVKAGDPFALKREEFDVSRGSQKRLFQDRPATLQKDPKRQATLERFREPARKVGEVAQRGVQAIEGTPIPDTVRTGLQKLKHVRQVVNENVEEGLSKLFQGGKFPVTQVFGTQSSLYSGITKGSKHLGLDIGVPQGTPLGVPVSGKVVIGNDPNGWGLNVKIMGDNGTEYRFSHLSQISPAIIEAVRQGRKVGAGIIFGLSGGTPGSKGAGNTTGAHLDISTKRGGEYVDPQKLASIRRAIL